MSEKQRGLPNSTASPSELQKYYREMYRRTRRQPQAQQPKTAAQQLKAAQKQMRAIRKIQRLAEHESVDLPAAVTTPTQPPTATSQLQDGGLDMDVQHAETDDDEWMSPLPSANGKNIEFMLEHREYSRLLLDSNRIFVVGPGSHIRDVFPLFCDS